MLHDPDFLLKLFKLNIQSSLFLTININLVSLNALMTKPSSFGLLITTCKEWQ